jgi:hypothetical protein
MFMLLQLFYVQTNQVFGTGEPKDNIDFGRIEK